MEGLCALLAGDVQANFTFRIFLMFQIVSKMHFIIKGAYAPKSQNATSSIVFYCET
jgi:hypothetical protein